MGVDDAAIRPRFARQNDHGAGRRHPENFEPRRRAVSRRGVGDGRLQHPEGRERGSEDALQRKTPVARTQANRGRDLLMANGFVGIETGVGEMRKLCEGESTLTI